MKTPLRRIIALTILICALPGIGGCGRAAYNYREVERLLVIQTMGIDSLSGGVKISLASAAGSGEAAALRKLSGSGDCISSALERIYERSNEEELFYYHIDNILIGEEAAEDGIEDYLRFICRSPYMRVKSPIFVLRGDKAEDAVMETGTDSKGVSEVMQSIRQRLQRRGAGNLTDAVGVIGSLRRYGSALVCAVEVTDSAESGGEEKDKSKTASVSGYGVIREGRLCRYIEAEDAMAVDLIKNDLTVCEVQISDRHGRPVVLEIFESGCDILPVWSAPGTLKGLDVRARISATVLEAAAGGGMDDSEYADQLTAKLEEYVSEKLRQVLQSSGDLRADFLGLAGRIEQASPRYFRMMSGDFPDVLPLLELQISVSGAIVHLNDLKEA